LGHDLVWGTAEFSRTVLVREDPEDDEPDESELEAEGELVGAKRR
jgi:hypothetical protein